MKKLRIIAKVYDRKTMEYVQRIAEIPVTDEVITGIQAALQSGDSCPILPKGKAAIQHSATRPEPFLH